MDFNKGFLSHNSLRSKNLWDWLYNIVETSHKSFSFPARIIKIQQNILFLVWRWCSNKSIEIGKKLRHFSFLMAVWKRNFCLCVCVDISLSSPSTFPAILSRPMLGEGAGLKPRTSGWRGKSSSTVLSSWLHSFVYCSHSHSWWFSSWLLFSWLTGAHHSSGRHDIHHNDIQH